MFPYNSRLLQIRQIQQETDSLKRSFRSHFQNKSAEVEKYTNDIQLRITVLDDLYVCGTNLADRRPDRELMREFTSVSKELSNMGQKPDFERLLIMMKPLLHSGISLMCAPT